MNNKIYKIFVIPIIPSIIVFLALSFVSSHGQEFDDISPITITKQDDTKFVIEPDFLIVEGYKSITNDIIQESKVMLSPGDSVKISYISPCGFANSIEGFFLKGTADIAIKSLSSTGPIQTMQITGEQHQFFKKQNPGKEGIEVASVPTDIEISALEDSNTDKDKIVFIMDCDEEQIYYIADSQIS